MKRVLLIKTSSMGDLIHTLPALTDAVRAYPELSFDWVLEAPFKDIAKWHPAVARVIPCDLRRWRRSIWQTWRSGQWREFKSALRAEKYDWVIDAQGLLKSAWLTRLSRVKRRAGFDSSCARESLASLAYTDPVKVDASEHAIARIRALFAHSLGYAVPKTDPDYGLDKSQFTQPNRDPKPYVVFLHGTTWDSKLWPLAHWQTLARNVANAGFQIKVAWGNEAEKARAQSLARIDAVSCLPRLDLNQLAIQLAGAAAVVAVDTGLGHLAAALSVPTLSLYGATDAARTGTRGQLQYHLQSHYACSPCLKKVCPLLSESQTTPPCYDELSANRVWRQLQTMLPVGLSA